MHFDPSAARARIEKFWALNAEFGMEHNAYRVYLSEIVSDRYVLVNGLQLIRDELQLAGEAESDDGDDVVACGADLSLPSVMTTLAHTNCGDRIHQGEATSSYEQVVASRFATMSEIGEHKLEAFSPTGGGTDDGHTLAHVTVAHMLDEPIRQRFYAGHPQSFLLVNVDLKTHVGRLEQDGKLVLGKTQESKCRGPPTACRPVGRTTSAGRMVGWSRSGSSRAGQTWPRRNGGRMRWRLRFTTSKIPRNKMRPWWKRLRRPQTVFASKRASWSCW